MKNEDGQASTYQDDYFARRHWGRKSWQTLVAILCWLVLLVPCVVTIGTYLAYITDGQRGYYFWHYREGFSELDLLIILLFCIGVGMAIFCLVVGGIQNRRRKRVLEKGPMYDVPASDRQVERAEQLAAAHFGPRHSQYNAHYYTVKPAQNFAKDDLKDTIKHDEEGQK